jgi:hypothetical protein
VSDCEKLEMGLRRMGCYPPSNNSIPNNVFHGMKNSKDLETKILKPSPNQLHPRRSSSFHLNHEQHPRRLGDFPRKRS